MTQQRIIKEIEAQPGPQTDFLSTKADIAFYGGAAGGGKSFALLLEPLRHYHNKNFNCAIFRRQATQVLNPGGLWDESEKIYYDLLGTPLKHRMEWTFPSGATIKFAHLENDKSVIDWQGSQIAFIGFDELTHFSFRQFIYMLSRNRSTCGVKPYVRGTCNPDAESWVREWVDWYIDEEGYAIPEKSGVIRWFVRLNDVTHWGETREELIERFGPETLPKSFTFIPSKLTDNKILMEKDPDYAANLKSLTKVDNERLEKGNWNIKASAGSLFQEQWFEVVDVIPHGWTRSVRFWDRAATKPTPEYPDPDWTRGLKLLKYPDGSYLVSDLKSDRNTPFEIEKLIKNTASQDGRATEIHAGIDPGSAGKLEAGYFTRMLAGYIVKVHVQSQDKETRAKSVSAQCQAGNIKVLRAKWNEEFFTELESFPSPKSHDDIVDTFSGAFNVLCDELSILNVL